MSLWQPRYGLDHVVEYRQPHHLQDTTIHLLNMILARPLPTKPSTRILTLCPGANADPISATLDVVDLACGYSGYKSPQPSDTQRNNMSYDAKAYPKVQTLQSSELIGLWRHCREAYLSSSPPRARHHLNRSQITVAIAHAKAVFDGTSGTSMRLPSHPSRQRPGVEWSPHILRRGAPLKHNTNLHCSTLQCI